MAENSAPQNEPSTARTQPGWKWLAVAVAFAVVAWAIYYFMIYRKPVSALDGFAKCLTAKGTKMYGAWWCPHCKDQKEMFGNAFQYVNYIECSPPGEKTQNEVCKQAGLKGYPTWQFADGTRADGTVHLEALAEKTGCKLP